MKVETDYYTLLLSKYGLCEGLCGNNDDGEHVIVSIDEEKATIKTAQHNGFIRVNVYWKDGTREELYEH